MTNSVQPPRQDLYGFAFTNHVRSMFYAIQDRFHVAFCLNLLRKDAPKDWHQSFDYEFNRQVVGYKAVDLSERVQWAAFAERDSNGNLHYHGLAIFPSKRLIKRDATSMHDDVTCVALEPVQTRIEAVAKKYWAAKADFYIGPIADYQHAIDYTLKEFTPTTEAIFDYIDLRGAEFLATQKWSFGQWHDEFKRTGRVTGKSLPIEINELSAAMNEVNYDAETSA